MKFTTFLLIASLLFSNAKLIAQKSDDTILKFEDENVSKAEFKRLYLKNNSGDVINKSSVEEYLDLFINFKLKVKEAESMGLDTMQSFIDELSDYRRQLAQPYLSAEGVLERLKKEAYQRMQEEIRASHILIEVDKNASPKDSLKAYKEAKKVLSLLQDGSDFTRTALKYSDDESVKQNNGDLGYFTVFQMVYPFETAAYNTPEGEISDIVRSDFGFHILKVTDRRPANGKVLAAHILISGNQQISNTTQPEHKIREIYKRLENGEDFSVLAKQFSDDNHSARRGGQLPPFKVNQMDSKFEEHVLALEEGAYSEPFQTQYGWHIVKLINKAGIPPYREMEKQIAQKVKQDRRGNLTKGAVLKKIKTQYGFKENKDALEAFYPIVGDEYLQAEWKVKRAKKLNKTLFSIGDHSVNQQDFAKYLAKQQRKRKQLDTDVLVYKMYENFVRAELLKYKDKQLEKEEPEFKALVKEYHDGILLFNLTDQMVWSKAIEDTLALKKYYENNKDKYRWKKRLEAVIYSVPDEATAEKAITMIEGGANAAEIAESLNQKSQLNLKYEAGKFSKGEDAIIDEIKWKTGISKKIKNNGRLYFVNVKAILEPSYKALEEARGLVISDYQNQLEQAWINQLREKYNYELNRSVLKALKKELK